MVKLWKNSEFIRSVSTLMTGTVLAQLISYLVYPLITRLYETHEMGDLGLYMRWVAFLAAFATARYELAIPIPKDKTKAFQLYRLALKLALVILLASLVFFSMYYTFVGWTQSRFFFMGLVICSAYVTVWTNAGTSWAVRHKFFKQISFQRMTNSLGINGFRYGFGLLGWGSFGLLLGSFVGMFLSSLTYVKSYFQTQPKGELVPSVSLQSVAKEFQVYPKVNLPHALMELGIDLSIAGLIVLYFDKSSFGSFSHAFLMLRLPVAIMGQSVGQVFFQRCSEKVHQGISVLPEFTKTSKVLFAIGLLPFTVLFFWGHVIFPFVFGEKWLESGYFAEWMAPYLFINFIISPLSTLTLVLHRQKEAFWIGLLVGGIQLFCFGILPIFNWSLQMVLAFNFGVLFFVLIGVFFVYRYFVQNQFDKLGGDDIKPKN